MKAEFGVNVCTNTIQRRIKALGFRLGDFKRYPRERNSVKAIVQGYNVDSATEMPSKCGETTLYKALYSDEMSIVPVLRTELQ